MPTYEYECQKCGYHFERFQNMSDKPLQRCPECKGKVKRLIGTGAGLLFKGSGFYITDYRSDNYKNGAKAETSKAKDTGSSSDTKATKKKDSASGKKKKTDAAKA